MSRKGLTRSAGNSFPPRTSLTASRRSSRYICCFSFPNWKWHGVILADINAEPSWKRSCSTTCPAGQATGGTLQTARAPPQAENAIKTATLEPTHGLPQKGGHGWERWRLSLELGAWQGLDLGAFSTSWWKDKPALCGSTTVSLTSGEGIILNVSMIQSWGVTPARVVCAAPRISTIATLLPLTPPTRVIYSVMPGAITPPVGIR